MSETAAPGAPYNRSAATDLAKAGEFEALARLELLASVSRLLAGVLDDVAPALRGVAESCVPDFFDLVVVEVPGPAGAVDVVAYRVAPTAGLRAPAEWTPVGRAAAPDAAPVLGWSGADEAPGLRAAREWIGADSVVVVPMPVGGVLLGWLVLANGRSRRGMRPSALRLGTELGARIGMAVHRSLLYREAKGAVAEQAQVVRRLRRVAGAAASLSGATTTGEVLRLACVEACIILDAPAAAVRWRPAGREEIGAQVGDPDPAAVGEAARAVAGGRPARGTGWVALPLLASDTDRGGALVLFVERALSADQELAFSSLASLVPVALERAASTEAAVLHEARLRSVLESSPVAILSLDNDGTVAGGNGAAAELFGWQRGAGELPPELRPALLAVADQVRRGGAVTDRSVVSDGFDLSVSGWVRPGLTDDEEATVAVAATDLRERRRGERTLIQAQRLEAMGQVAGRVAHDFNNLLTLIVGYSAMLQQSVQAESDQHMLAQIDGAAGRAAELTRQMLGLTRRQVDTGSVVDLAGALRTLGAVVERVAGDGVRVSVDVPAEAFKVAIEQGDVEQIVLNLAINACDAMDHAGDLAVTLSGVDASAAEAAPLGLPPGPYARIVVADDGPGMTSAVVARCMEPFFTTKGHGRGSGLGLSTVYGLTAERGGAVRIDSSVGQGTSVEVWLPRLEGAEPTAAAGDAAAPWPPDATLSARVVLVEDEQDLRELAVAALSGIGVEVLATSSAEAVLDDLEALGDIDALLTDVVLPGMTGMELANRLRTARPGLPVLYMTGYAGPPDAQALVAGSRTLRKPYRPDELRHVVASMLRAAQGSNR